MVTNQETGKRRLCVDYFQTAHLYAVLFLYRLSRIEVMILKLAKYRVSYTFDLKNLHHQLQMRDRDKPFTAFEVTGWLWEYNRRPFAYQFFSHEIFQPLLY